jgi:hypothetical protein
MAIPVEIETVLNAALADKPDALTFIKGLDAKAERFTPEVEAAIPKLGDLAKLPELQTQASALQKVLGDLKAKDADSLIRDFNNLKTVNADLVKQRATGGGGGTGDVTQSPEYKALMEKLEAATTDFNTKLGDITKKLDTEATEKASAVKSQRETDLKAALVTAGAKHKIKDVEDEFLLLQAKGLVGHKEVEGKHVPFFYRLNEKGEKVDAGSADALMKHIAETAKHKVDASGKGGAGAAHGGTGGGTGEGPKTAAEARKAMLHG